MDPFIGLIRAFGFNWAPQGWFPCDGRTLSIQQYAPLYSIIGITYGGDGKTNFKLPNLNPTVQNQPGLAMIGTGQGTASQAPYKLGQVTGVPGVTLTAAQLPTHGHSVNAITVTLPLVPAPVATNTTYLSRLEAPLDTTTYNAYTTDTPTNAQLNAGAVGQSGASAPAAHDNFQPYQAVNFCIAWDGIYPEFP
jgi:microcystin-dependent protein